MYLGKHNISCFLQLIIEPLEQVLKQQREHVARQLKALVSEIILRPTRHALQIKLQVHNTQLLYAKSCKGEYKH